MLLLIRADAQISLKKDFKYIIAAPFYILKTLLI